MAQLHLLIMTFQRYNKLRSIPTDLSQLIYCITQNYIAACGCTGKSTHYPTAALSQMAFGSSQNYGPSCGRCFKLTLLNSYTASPPFFPATHPSVVVKVTDLCPLSQTGWCSATENKTNPCVLDCYFLFSSLSWHQVGARVETDARCGYQEW